MPAPSSATTNPTATTKTLWSTLFRTDLNILCGDARSLFDPTETVRSDIQTYLSHLVQVQCSLATSQTISHNSRSSKYAAKRAKVFGSREPEDWRLTAHLARCRASPRRSLLYRGQCQA